MLRLGKLLASVVEGTLGRLEFATRHDAPHVQLPPLVHHPRCTVYVLDTEAEDALEGLAIFARRLDDVPHGAGAARLDGGDRLGRGDRADQKQGGGQHGVAGLQVDGHGPHCTLSVPATASRVGRASRPTTKGTAMTT